ncbi:MAG: hybrid sensor histidine kinase/response regulator [Chlamydiales bacterium]|nr:hybrid sensor histidine kinase/response regulator [Chlamydiales bacterium]
METAIESLQVLVVEDSATQALLLKESLENHQLQVWVAGDGMDALEQMRQHPPNVVITDIAMPRMNGFDFCTRVRSEAKYSHIPVILLTSLTDPMDVIKGIACGADSFLTKPCDITFLLSTIKDVVKNKQAVDVSSNAGVGQKLAFFFNGNHHVLHIDHVQITNLLLSTYLNAVQKNGELEASYHKLNSAYEEIKKKNDQLQGLNEQKNRFLGMAAHDLRNPLGVIMGYCTLLKTRLADTKVDDKFFTMLDKIYSSSGFMLKLINDLLDVAVIEAGTVSLHLSEVSMVELIQETLTLFSSLAQKKDIVLNFKPNPGVPKIQCDANKVVQVLNNLISNAVKFSRPGAIVEVGLENTRTDVTFSVTDFGIGIRPEAQKTLFQPFAQTGSIGTAGEKSTGLGLSIAQKIVQEHNGKIWFTSEVGKGTKFFVTLPINPRK